MCGDSENIDAGTSGGKTSYCGSRSDSEGKPASGKESSEDDSIRYSLRPRRSQVNYFAPSPPVEEAGPSQQNGRASRSCARPVPAFRGRVGWPGPRQWPDKLFDDSDLDSDNAEMARAKVTATQSSPKAKKRRLAVDGGSNSLSVQPKPGNPSDGNPAGASNYPQAVQKVEKIIKPQARRINRGPLLSVQPKPTGTLVADPERIEGFTRQFLLGEELVNARFYVFSARSLTSRQIIKPRVLFANNLLLAKSSNYFLDLLRLDIDPSDPSFVELPYANDPPSSIQMDDYGYGSDSDLDDCDDLIPEMLKVRSTMSSSKRKRGEEYEDKDHGDELDGGSESVQGSRSILVKDAAFQTWYTLLNYLSTGKIVFSPLSSARPGERLSSSTSWSDRPRCSAKSIYRLACKVGLNDLRDQALAHIRSNLNDDNILSEITCSLVGSHPQLLDMELNALYSYISTPAVATNFPALLRRIANKEIPHGAEIMISIHSKLLGVHRPLSSGSLSIPVTPSDTLPAPRTTESLPSLASSSRVAAIQKKKKPYSDETALRTADTDALEYMD